MQGHFMTNSDLATKLFHVLFDGQVLSIQKKVRKYCSRQRRERLLDNLITRLDILFCQQFDIPYNALTPAVYQLLQIARND